MPSHVKKSKRRSRRVGRPKLSVCKPGQSPKRSKCRSRRKSGRPRKVGRPRKSVCKAGQSPKRSKCRPRRKSGRRRRSKSRSPKRS